MAEEKLIFRENLDWEFHFESFGVSISVESNRHEMLEEARQVIVEALPDNVRFIENENSGLDHRFSVMSERGSYTLVRNGEQIRKSDIKWRFLRFFNSMIRLEVAEYADSKVFLHAGVVAWKGNAIVMPALSFSGKSTLTAELIRIGTVYYSDEYAVLDENGFVHPFPRKLSIRSPDGLHERDVPAEDLGGTTGHMPIPVGMLLFTEFVEDAHWDPLIMTPGNGIIEVIPHTIPFRYKPEFSLKVLDIVARRAIIVKSARADVKKFAKILLAFFDNHLN